jgi:hypothetical protein
LGEGGFAGEIAAAPPCSRSRRFSRTPVDPLFAAPPLGSDSRAIVDEIGWGRQLQLAQLRSIPNCARASMKLAKQLCVPRTP